MKHPRPVNLNLFTIHFPIPAIVSILHRITGVILFLIIPFLIWGLNLSLSSAEGFNKVHNFLIHPLSKLLLFATLAAFIYHLIAGIRHLLMDAGIGEELKSGRAGAQLTIAISIILILLAGIWIW